MKASPTFNIISELEEDEKEYIIEKLKEKIKSDYQKHKGFHILDYNRDNELITFEIHLDYDNDENRYDCIVCII